MPDFNYTVNVKINNGTKTLIRILMIDTIKLCGNAGYDEDEKKPIFYSKEDEIISKQYFEDIENNLKRLNNTYIPYVFVAGHFPVWSIAEHGPTQCLVEKLRPMLHKYKVSAYLAGHDHNMQFIEDTYLNSTVDYVVSGACNFNHRSYNHLNDIPKGSLKFQKILSARNIFVGGFVFAEANEKKMKINIYNSIGTKLFQKIILPRK